MRVDGMHGKRAFRVPRDSCCSATRNSEESRFASGKSRADFPLETRRERERENVAQRDHRDTASALVELTIQQETLRR